MDDIIVFGYINFGTHIVDVTEVRSDSEGKNKSAVTALAAPAGGVT